MNSPAELALTDWPLLLAEALTFGTAGFVALLTPGDAAARDGLGRALAPLWKALAVLALVSAPMALIGEVSNMAAISWRGAIPLVPEVLRQTHAGRIWTVRIAAIVLIIATAWLISSCRLKAAILSLLSVLILLLNALSSHAIDWGALAVAAYLFHQVAASMWFGALLVMCWPFKGIEHDPSWNARLGTRVSSTAGWSVAVLVVTGVFVAYQTLGLDLSRLLYSKWGRTLIVKVAAFLMVACIGGYNRYLLIPAMDDVAARRQLLRNVAIECAFLIFVFGLAALLANSPPPHMSML
ncbi:MAG: copper resistance D family protein [Candidatus Binataceae bacterium]